jgi:hypothetical protein
VIASDWRAEERAANFMHMNKKMFHFFITSCNDALIIPSRNKLPSNAYRAMMILWWELSVWGNFYFILCVNFLSWLCTALIHKLIRKHLWSHYYYVHMSMCVCVCVCAVWHLFSSSLIYLITQLFCERKNLYLLNQLDYLRKKIATTFKLGTFLWKVQNYFYPMTVLNGRRKEKI